MPYNFVVSVHILYNYFVVVMKTFIVTRSNETNASLWSFMGGVGGSLTSVPRARGTTWHWCLRTFHGVIHELLTSFGE